jgi:choline transport protein
MAVVLGLYNSMTALVALDASCHMAEEIKSPTTMIPRILYITIGVQFLVGIVWILAIGFSIQDSEAIIDGPSG